MNEKMNYVNNTAEESARAYGGQCLPYVTGLYAQATGITSSGNANAKEYWNNSTSSERKMHVCAPSVAIWFNGTDGHAGFISRVDADGTIHYTDSNYRGDEQIENKTFTDPYYLGQRCSNFKGYVQRATSRVD